MNRKELKARAREQLGNEIFGNSWLMALGVCAVAGLLTAAAGTVVPGLGAIIIVGPITFALSAMFLKGARDGKSMEFGELFQGFGKDFGQNFLIGLMTAIYTFLWGLLLIIPGIIKYYAYSMAYYIKADHPDYDWRRCIDESMEMMRGHKWQLFVLDLSFIGWYIVGALCLGVGTLWVVPYESAAKAQFYESIKN